MRLITNISFGTENLLSHDLQIKVDERYLVYPVHSNRSHEEFIDKDGIVRRLKHCSLGVYCRGRISDIEVLKKLANAMWEQVGNAWKAGAFVMWRKLPTFTEIENENYIGQDDKDKFLVKISLRLGSTSDCLLKDNQILRNDVTITKDIDLEPVINDSLPDLVYIQGMNRLVAGARWYSVSRLGMATLSADKENATKNAAMSNESFPFHAPYHAAHLVDTLSVILALLSGEVRVIRPSEETKTASHENEN